MVTQAGAGRRKDGRGINGDVGVWSGGCCRDRHRQHGASGLDEKKTTFIN